MIRKAVLGAALVAAALTPAIASAAEKGVKLGILSCELTDKTNVIVYTNETFNCIYNPNSGGTEQYDGAITRIGIDLEWKPNQQLIWTVVAPTTDIKGGALAGDYGGVSASASLGAGAGGKVLVGGFEKSITLQPLAIAGSTGVGASAGIEALKLTSK
ncbi:MAG: DUF992 domain-containing protein [Pseudomonadota bacterium]